jgi:allophanate hydrolase subunit 2
MSLMASVRAPGLATVQDGGRPGFTGVGVPVSGPFHRVRYLVATALLSGEPDVGRPAVELLDGTCILEMAATTVMAVVGPATLVVDGRPQAVGAVVRVETGAVVEVEHAGPGPAYLVIDGWQSALTLGSASTDTFSRLGFGALRAGDELTGEPTGAGPGRVGAFHRPIDAPVGPIRVVDAGHRAVRAFASATWTVSSVARSGARLVGGPIPASGTVASMALLPGAIQLTPSGEVVILGPDGGLTGGYPVVGVVATVDLDRLSLLGPGDVVAVRIIPIDEAVAARRQQLASLRRSVAHPDHLP